jgi:hypothetical protein
MTNSIKNRSYNVRVTFDAEGNPIIGAVLGFYTVDSDCYDIRPVKDDSILKIAKALGITRSSKTLLVNRKAKKKAIVDTEPLVVVAEVVQLEIISL